MIDTGCRGLEICLSRFGASQKSDDAFINVKVFLVDFQAHVDAPVMIQIESEGSKVCWELFPDHALDIAS